MGRVRGGETDRDVRYEKNILNNRNIRWLAILYCSQEAGGDES